MLFRILLTLALGTAVANAAPTATAQPQARFVSLRECIELALTRNLDIQISRLNSDMMGYSLTGAYVPYVPVLSFMARHEFVSQPGDVDPQKFKDSMHGGMFTCVDCHTDVKISPHENTPAKISCGTCHNHSSGNQHFSVNKEICFTCHFVKTQEKNKGVVQSRCLDCHTVPQGAGLSRDAPAGARGYITKPDFSLIAVDPLSPTQVYVGLIATAISAP